MNARQQKERKIRRALAKGRELAEAWKIVVVAIAEIPPKNVEVNHTIIRRITMRLFTGRLYARICGLFAGDDPANPEENPVNASVGVRG